MSYAAWFTLIFALIDFTQPQSIMRDNIDLFWLRFFSQQTENQRMFCLSTKNFDDEEENLNNRKFDLFSLRRWWLRANTEVLVVLGPMVEAIEDIQGTLTGPRGSVHLTTWTIRVSTTNAFFLSFSRFCGLKIVLGHSLDESNVFVD